MRAGPVGGTCSVPVTRSPSHHRMRATASGFKIVYSTVPAPPHRECAARPSRATPRGVDGDGIGWLAKRRDGPLRVLAVPLCHLRLHIVVICRGAAGGQLPLATARAL